MDRVQRILTLHRLLLAHRQGLGIERLMQATGASRATVYRDLHAVETQFGITLDKQDTQPGERVFRFPQNARKDEALHLPGLWLSADQLFGLQLARRLVLHGGGGQLADSLSHLEPRLKKLIGNQATELDRLRVLHTQCRRIDPAVFRTVTEATLQRRRLQFRYRSRTRGASAEARLRHVSPQLLTMYRENWYLDAYDHDAEDLRSFALDLIAGVRFEPGDTPTRNLPPAELETHLQRGYGFHAGPILGIAIIRFSPSVAPWVAAEDWHPEQRTRHLRDGSLILRLPYASARQLLMDVLKYGPDAEVIGPKALREEMVVMVRGMGAVYGTSKQRAHAAASPEPASRRDAGQ